MDDRVHFLATPQGVGDISRRMQRLSRQYVGLFNGRYGRTGTLWEGRYKACLLDSDDYELACYRYIELKPVRAWMIDDPGAYRWSSCAANLGRRPQSSLCPHPAWLYLQQQRAWGRDDFRALAEARTRRFAGTPPAHRPRKLTSLEKWT